MAAKQSLGRRWDDYQPSKTAVFWSCAGCIAATMIVGFAWGGWVTGGTAAQMVTQASQSARAELAATICVNRFANGPDATAKLASLKGTDTWKQDEFIEKGGWATLPGTENPVTGAAAICARQLMDVKLPVKAASAPG
jgi:hypothetical protein